MQKSTSLFNWEKAFENLSIKEKAGLLNNTLLKIFCNYIPNKIVNCSYRDPPWISKQIKSKLKNRSKIRKECYRKGQDPIIFAELRRISRMRIKNQLYSKRSNVLNDKHTDPKVYWTVLNNFLNNIKILSVLPVLASGETITNIVEKANIFNESFAT